MANKDYPAGLRPYGEVKSLQKYTAGAACYPGDLVNLESDGKVDPYAASDKPLGVAATYAAADGDDVLVWDDPDQKFSVQSDDATAPANVSAVGLNYDVVATAGDSTYKISRMELDGSGSGTDSTKPLRLIGLHPAVDNAFGAQADCIVVINNHRLGKNSEGL